MREQVDYPTLHRRRLQAAEGKGMSRSLIAELEKHKGLGRRA